jgi:uncharacterized protein
MRGIRSTKQRGESGIAGPVTSDPLEAARGHDLKRFQALLTQGARVDPANPHVILAFLEAAHEGRRTLVQTLLEQGLGVNASLRKDQILELRHYYQGLFEGNRTALMLAARQGHEPIMRLLIENGAEVNARSDDQASALIFACSNNLPDVAELLVNAGAEVNVQDEFGQSALMEIYHRDHDHETMIALTRLLLVHGVDVEASNTNGETAIVFAVQSGCLECIRMLLDAGADPNRELPDGRNLAVLSVSVNYRKDIFEVLIAAGAKMKPEYRAIVPHLK